MRRSLAHVVCQGLSVLAIVSLVAGCQKSDERAAQAPPAPTVRHDLPELVKRFPPLGEPLTASWVTWDDDQAGAPAEWNVEYLDAVITLNPLASNALIAVTKPTDTGRKPLVQEVLRPEVPAGPFLTGDVLDSAFSSPAASTYAYLDRGSSTLVLQSTGVRN
jgi:hypothetical protein